MRSTAWHDAIRLRSRRGWFTPVFQLLLVASIVLAVPAAPPIPPSARRAAGLCVRRVLVGCMSWQQSRRKIPPDFAALCDWNGLGVYPRRDRPAALSSARLCCHSGARPSRWSI